ncbi:hypothetical protein CRX72_23870 [Pantoea sp. BRM17]|nr:hypothetical protein CRX72_23870 [Pantoea sp. BRM17]
MMETILEFRNEMAAQVIRFYEMNPYSKPIIARWRDWDDLWAGGYRTDNAGEAFREWLTGV